MSKTPVIVECRAPRSASLGTANVAPQLLRIDNSYSAVPIYPAASELQLSVDARQEQLILVRGAIEPTRLDDLRTDSAVVDVNLDAELFPFHISYGLPNCDDWLVDVGDESPTD